MEQLDPAVALWFQSRYPSLTSIQATVIRRVLAREHVLGLSPTGTGKTWAAFLGIISELARARRAGPIEGTFALYVSPLKALSANVRLALDGPLSALNEALRLPKKDHLLAAARTGDTSSSERARHRKRPPHILLTTPESLSTMLAQKAWHPALSRIRYVVVDEIHAMAESKRGVLLSLNLEHLERLVPAPFVRIGLSATAHPPEALAEFLGGVDRQVFIESSSDVRQHRLTLVVPSLEIRSEGATATAPDEHRDRLRKAGIPVGGLTPERRAQIARRLKVKLAEPSEESVVEDDPSTRVTPVPARARRPLPVAGHPTARAAPDVVRLIEGSKTALVFTNTRAATELLTLRLRELLPGERIEAHHGSLDSRTRARVESQLAAGELRVCVCSSSLELGIDISAVDRVLLLASPKGVARTLQRLGRAGHRVQGIAEGTLIPVSQLDLAECVATREAARTGRLEPVRLPRKPLDVLAQSMLGAIAAGPLRDDLLFETVRRSDAYRTLTRQEFDAALNYLLGRGAVLGHYDEFSKVTRDEHGELIIRSPRVLRDYLLNVGTIASDLSVLVCTRRGKKLGHVEESFVTTMPTGTVFSVGGRPVELLRVEGLKAYVRPARGSRVVVPRWRGARMALSSSLENELMSQRTLARDLLSTGAATGELAARFTERYRLDASPASSLAELYALQHRASRIPDGQHLVVEEVQEGKSLLLFVHSVAGRAANAAVAMVMARRAAGGRGAVVTASDDTGVLLSLPARTSVRGADAIRSLLSPEGFVETLNSAIDDTEAVLRVFRGVAQVGQLLLRRNGRTEKGARSSQWSASVLFRTLRQYDPGHPLLTDARRELVQDELQAQRAHEALEHMASLPLEYVVLPRPSPLVLGLYASASREAVGTEDADLLLEELVDDLEARWKKDVA